MQVPTALIGCQVWRVAFDYQTRLLLVGQNPDGCERVSADLVIETPFVLVQVSEQNGAPLYRGPAVSKRTIRGGGLALTFFLGQYPSVELASSPALLPMAIGVLMLAASLAGYGWAALRRSPAR